MAAGGDFKPHVPRLYRFAATGLGASMWFWLMWRAKKDGATTPMKPTRERVANTEIFTGPALLGWKHPWDH
ncbi:hypothetical protein QBC47DRAFT_396710 [Echria macrotheca]|uniref:Uncharacterized protein n=1 Tax=Echria macrotheca TaxID=438768 RepID=A0AAJ0FEV7_9PEZI|nr:hypothetical protein QBC47DRAFT_396710 [Echria macrotheca]